MPCPRRAPEVRAYLGFTAHRLNRSTDEPAADRGVEMVKVVLAGHKELDSVWVLMGRIMRDRGNESGAARCFQQALRLNPANADAVHEMRQGAGGGSASGKSGGLLSRWFGGKG